MTVSKTAIAERAKPPARSRPSGGGRRPPLQMGELSELLGYSLKRAQLKVFEDFLRCVAPLQLTPAQFSVLLLLDRNPGRNQTEIANTLGILRPNFVAMLDGLESRDLCARIRSTNDRRSHILVLTDKGRAVLARAKKLVATKHEARLNELLGPANRAALLAMLAKIAESFRTERHCRTLHREASAARADALLIRGLLHGRDGSRLCGAAQGRRCAASRTRTARQSTKITLTSLTLVSVGPVSSRSPVAAKNAVASLLAR